MRFGTGHFVNTPQSSYGYVCDRWKRLRHKNAFSSFRRGDKNPRRNGVTPNRTSDGENPIPASSHRRHHTMFRGPSAIRDAGGVSSHEPPPRTSLLGSYLSSTVAAASSSFSSALWPGLVDAFLHRLGAPSTSLGFLEPPDGECPTSLMTWILFSHQQREITSNSALFSSGTAAPAAATPATRRSSGADAPPTSLQAIFEKLAA